MGGIVGTSVSGLYFSNQGPNLKNLNRSLNLSRGSNMVGST